MKITKMKSYDGAKDEISRPGLAGLFIEVQQIILDTQIALVEEKKANGAAVIREALDASFVSRGDWQKKASGRIDWIKRIRYNETVLSRIGVEVQVSARSDLLLRDIVHLRNSLQAGEIDVGVIVLPDDRFHFFLPGHTQRFRDANRYMEEEFEEAMTFPIIVVAIEYDAPGQPLMKRLRSR